MNRFFERLRRVLDRPIGIGSRIALVALSAIMFLSFQLPLWRYSMEAPQYPKGLYVDIYFHRLEAGNDGHDIDEINELNHYIGMMKIDRSQLIELDWIPFAFGVLMLLATRSALIGDGRSLVDLTVLTFFLIAFTGGRFIYKLYAFGHFLDPAAPVKIEPFTPVILGTKQVANFTTHSYPRSGSAIVFSFAAGIALITIWHFRGLVSRVKHPIEQHESVESASTR